MFLKRLVAFFLLRQPPRGKESAQVFSVADWNHQPRARSGAVKHRIPGSYTLRYAG